MINLKTAEKTLQFGVTKCKSMLICKQGESALFSDLMVDSWEVEYKDNPETGSLSLVETFSGPTKIEQTTSQTYLGFVLSSTGDNMAHINMIKKKSIGVMKKIFNRLNGLSLQKYYFECSMIFLNVMLRPSILYGCDMMYNLKEIEIRQIERIEESYMRKVLNTTRGYPIVQLYLEMGHTPARVEIQKSRLLFMQHILQQTEDSTINRFFKLQLEMPTRGDWAAMCLKDLDELDIKESLESIRLMNKNKFSSILRDKTRISSLKYLTEKQGTKGKEIQYEKIEMSEYLLPFNNKLTIEGKRRLFSARNKMVNISSNFSSSKLVTNCICGEQESMQHIYNTCKMLTIDENSLPYEKIYFGQVNEQIEICQSWKKKKEIQF